MTTARISPLIVIAAALASACGSAAVVTRPQAALSTSTPAETAFDEVHDVWARERAPRSPALRDMLIAFLSRFPNDGLSPLAHTYLAVTLMDQDDYARAEVELGRADRALLGNTRDFVNVARAKSLRHAKQPEYALELLRPLVGKMIDPVERELFLEEISLSAVDAKLSYEALAYMDAWLRGVTEDERDAVRAKVKTAMSALPREVVETTYRLIRKRGQISSYSRDLERIIAVRLGEIAVAENDAALARWLLDPESGGSVYPSEEIPQDLGELATSRRGIKTVYGKMVGLLLSSQTDEERDRSAEVARGVAYALGLPRPSGAEPLDVRLVTRSDGGDFQHAELALDELTGEGVSVVIAGVSGASADRAQRYCEAHQVPLILLNPGAEAAQASTFMLGVAQGADLPALASALTSEGLAKVALVTNAQGERALEVGAIETQGMLSLSSVTSCDVLPAQAGEPRFPVFAWDRAGLRGVIVSGNGDCSRDVISESHVFYNKEPTFALTLDAAESSAEIQMLTRGTRARVISAQAGIFPVLSDSPEVVSDADLVSFMASAGGRPTWWSALGRDAGVLARRAVTPLPESGATDAREVTQRRSIVMGGLFATRTKLWTTEAKGFEADRAVARTLRVVTWPKK